MTGVLFWQASASDEYMWAEYTDGTTLLNKLAANKWTKIFQDNTGKLEPGTVASLRAVVKEGKLTMFVGSKQIKVIRAQTPTGDLAFGVLAEVEKLSDANPVLQVKSFKVTTGEGSSL